MKEVNVFVRRFIATLILAATASLAFVATGAGPAFADPCPESPGAPVGISPQHVCVGSVNAQATATGGGRATFLGNTFGWSKGTIRIWGEAYQDGTLLFSRGPVKCSPSTSCGLHHDVDCSCWTGWIHWQVYATRNNTNRIVDDTWVYVTP